MYIDRIDVTLSSENMTAVSGGFTVAESNLTVLPSVSAADRKRLAKMGLKNEALALQIIEVGRANPDLIPRGIDFEKIDRDIAARAQVNQLLMPSRRVTSRLDDAKLLLGVDIYAAALAIYHSLKRNAKTTSLQSTVDELSRAFAKTGRTEPEPEPVGETPMP